MARISTLKRKKGAVYKAEVRLKGHPYVCQTFDRLSETQRWVKDTEKTLRSGGYIGDAAFNLDPRSANLNTEVGVLIRNKELASQVEGYITRDMLPENSWDISAGDIDSSAPFWKQVKFLC